MPHRGHRKAIVAVGRHILNISYHLLARSRRPLPWDRTIRLTDLRARDKRRRWAASVPFTAVDRKR